MSISQTRQRTFNQEQLRAASWLQANGHPVNDATVQRVLNHWQRQQQQPTIGQQAAYQYESVAAAAVPQQEVLPKAAPTPVVKYTHNTTNKVTSNRDIQLHEYRQDAVWVGIGVTCVVYWFAGSAHIAFLAVGSGAAAIGGVGAILRSISMWNADRHGDNAVQINADKEASRQERYRQQTEQLRITKHAELSALQIAQQREAQQLEQERLQQRQQARLAATQRQIEYTNRTVSETHYRATEQALQADFQPFDEEPLH